MHAEQKSFILNSEDVTNLNFKIFFYEICLNGRHLYFEYKNDVQRCIIYHFISYISFQTAVSRMIVTPKNLLQNFQLTSYFTSFSVYFVDKYINVIKKRLNFRRIEITISLNPINII